jgi:hypothetical protein
MIVFPPWFPFVVNWNQIPSIGLVGWWIETFDIMFASMFWRVGGFFHIGRKWLYKVEFPSCLLEGSFAFLLGNLILCCGSCNFIVRIPWCKGLIGPQTKIGNLMWTSVVQSILLTKRMKTTCFSSTLASVLTSSKVPRISILNATT